jgi:hypothetical protein
VKYTAPLALAVMLVARRAHAQVDPFEFEVYPYQTVGRGVVELESLNSYVPKGHTEGDSGLRVATSRAISCTEPHSS